MAAEKLRDLSQPIDVGLLDATVAAFYGTGSKEEVSDCSPITSSATLFFSLDYMRANSLSNSTPMESSALVSSFTYTTSFQV